VLQPGLDAYTSVLFTCNFPLILEVMGMVGFRFKGRDMIRITFSERNVVPGSTKHVDLGTCLTWQNHDDYLFLLYRNAISCQQS